MLLNDYLTDCDIGFLVMQTSMCHHFLRMSKCHQNAQWWMSFNASFIYSRKVDTCFVTPNRSSWNCKMLCFSLFRSVAVMVWFPLQQHCLCSLAVVNSLPVQIRQFCHQLNRQHMDTYISFIRATFSFWGFGPVRLRYNWVSLEYNVP